MAIVLVHEGPDVTQDGLARLDEDPDPPDVALETISSFGSCGGASSRTSHGGRGVTDSDLDQRPRVARYASWSDFGKCSSSQSRERLEHDRYAVGDQPVGPVRRSRPSSVISSTACSVVLLSKFSATRPMTITGA